MTPANTWAGLVAGRLETMLEVTGTAVACGGLLAVFLSQSPLAASLLGLPAGFGGRDTPAFMLAVVLGLLALPMILRRILAGSGLTGITGRPRQTALNAARAGLLTGCGLIAWSQILFLAIPDLLQPTWRSFGVTADRDIWLAVLWVAPLATALPEEIFFRGYAQGALSQTCGRGWGLLLVAALFTLAHAQQGAAAMLLSVLPAALALGLVYDATGHLLAPWLAHTVVNASSFLSLGIRDRDPDAGFLLGMLLLVMSLLVLLLDWRMVGRSCRDIWRRGLRLPADGEGLVLVLTAVVGLVAALSLVAGVTASLGGGDGVLMLAAAALLWAGALGLHHWRRAPWGEKASPRSRRAT